MLRMKCSVTKLGILDIKCYLQAVDMVEMVATEEAVEVNIL